MSKAGKLDDSGEKSHRADEASRKQGNRDTESSRSKSLEAVGVDTQEEKVYRALLMQRAATAEEVAYTTGLGPRLTQQLLRSIELKGLASHTAERPHRYIAASPELALESLVIRRQADLEHVRVTIKELKEQALGAAAASEHEQVVELITNRAALSQAVKQLLTMAKTDLVTFQCAPVLYPEGFVESDETVAPPKGVRARSISDDSFLALPGAVEQLRQYAEAGEESRVFPKLPVKMLVADRCLGLIPLNAQDPKSDVLLIRESGLLDAMCALFEIIWERSTPIKFGVDGKIIKGTAKAAMSDPTGKIIPLLAAGLNDKAIAYEAGISINTLTRRIAELMKVFHARTRFQLGWRAALSAYSEGADTSSKT